MLDFLTKESGPAIPLSFAHIEKINSLHESDVRSFLNDVLTLTRLSTNIKVVSDEVLDYQEIRLVSDYKFGLNSDVYATEQDVKRELDFIATYCDDPNVRSRYLFLSVFGDKSDVAMITADEKLNKQLKQETLLTVERRLDSINEQINKTLSALSLKKETV